MEYAVAKEKKTKSGDCDNLLAEVMAETIIPAEVSSRTVESPKEAQEAEDHTEEAEEAVSATMIPAEVSSTRAVESPKEAQEAEDHTEEAEEAVSGKVINSLDRMDGRIEGAVSTVSKIASKFRGASKIETQAEFFNRQREFSEKQRLIVKCISQFQLNSQVPRRSDLMLTPTLSTQNLDEIEETTKPLVIVSSEENHVKSERNHEEIRGNSLSLEIPVNELTHSREDDQLEEDVKDIQPIEIMNGDGSPQHNSPDRTSWPSCNPDLCSDDCSSSKDKNFRCTNELIETAEESLDDWSDKWFLTGDRCYWGLQSPSAYHLYSTATFESILCDDISLVILFALLLSIMTMTTTQFDPVLLFIPLGNAGMMRVVASPLPVLVVYSTQVLLSVSVISPILLSKYCLWKPVDQCLQERGLSKIQIECFQGLLYGVLFPIFLIIVVMTIRHYCYKVVLSLNIAKTAESKEELNALVVSSLFMAIWELLPTTLGMVWGCYLIQTIYSRAFQAFHVTVGKTKEKNEFLLELLIWTFIFAANQEMVWLHLTINVSSTF